MNTPGFCGATITYSTPECAYRQSGKKERTSLFCRLQRTPEETTPRKTNGPAIFLERAQRVLARSSSRVMTK